MKTVLHKASSRGHANHDWLNSYHTFSFAGYYDPSRVHFGMLRVLNDDTVKGGMGFGTHPHDNMEIISIPLEGDLEHKDNIGNTTVIRQNDIQIMSAGTGVQHSEYNRNKDKEVKFLQIWVFPRERDSTPRYDQITLNDSDRKNRFQLIVGPEKGKNMVQINQEAWFSLGKMDRGFKTTYSVNKVGNGVYAFVLNGTVKINNQLLHERDGYGIWEGSEFTIEAQSNSEVLLIEVPMN